MKETLLFCLFRKNAIKIYTANTIKRNEIFYNKISIEENKKWGKILQTKPNQILKTNK